VEPETVQWAWKGYIPKRAVTLFDGDPGLGKSTVALNIGARITNGEPMPDGSISDIDGPAGVVLLSAEDSLSTTIRPRLDAVGADVSKILALLSIVDLDGNPRPLTIGDLAAIEHAVHETRAQLVIIDPFMAYLDENTKSYSDQSIRRAIAPLAELADRLDIAVVVVRHLNKNAGANAMYRGGGSIGIIGAARSGLLIAQDPNDESVCVLASIKNNLAERPPSLTYRRETAPNGAMRIVWSGTSSLTANQLLAIPEDDEKRSATDQAIAFLEEVLAIGEVASTAVLKEARQAGIAERTLDRAKQRLGVVANRRGGLGADGYWCWSLRAPPSPKSANEIGGGLSKNGPNMAPYWDCKVCGQHDWKYSEQKNRWLCAWCFPGENE